MARGWLAQRIASPNESVIRASSMSLPRTLATRLAALLPTIDRGPLLAGLCGWADTGKSTLARETCRELVAAGVPADCLSTDAFLQDRAMRQALGITGYDPAALDASARRFLRLRVSLQTETTAP